MLSTSLDYWWKTFSWFVHFGQFFVKGIIISCKSSCKKIMQPLIEIHRQHKLFNLPWSFSLSTNITFDFFIRIKEWHINKHLFLMLFSSFPSSPWTVSTLCMVLVQLTHILERNEPYPIFSMFGILEVSKSRGFLPWANQVKDEA